MTSSLLELLVVMPRVPSFDAAFEDLTERLTVVARGLDLAWRQRVGRAAIAACLPYADLTRAIEARLAKRAAAAGSWQLPEQRRQHQRSGGDRGPDRDLAQRAGTARSHPSQNMPGADRARCA